jgi:hypothetical protein
MPQHWRLLMKMLRVLSEMSPSSRVNLWRCTGLERWPRRSPAAYLTHRLMVHGGWWSLRGSIGSSSRSFPFHELRALSFVLPLFAHHERGITCQRGCGPLLSIILKWPGSMPCFGRQ